MTKTITLMGIVALSAFALTSAPAVGHTITTIYDVTAALTASNQKGN